MDIISPAVCGFSIIKYIWNAVPEVYEKFSTIIRIGLLNVLPASYSPVSIQQVGGYYVDVPPEHGNTLPDESPCIVLLAKIYVPVGVYEGISMISAVTVDTVIFNVTVSRFIFPAIVWVVVIEDADLSIPFVAVAWFFAKKIMSDINTFEGVSI